MMLKRFSAVRTFAPKTRYHPTTSISLNVLLAAGALHFFGIVEQVSNPNTE
jgi:CO dehydrogenase/acetyl-CoA synthase epsilon subunit